MRTTLFGRDQLIRGKSRSAASCMISYKVDRSTREGKKSWLWMFGEVEEMWIQRRRWKKGDNKKLKKKTWSVQPICISILLSSLRFLPFFFLLLSFEKTSSYLVQAVDLCTGHVLYISFLLSSYWIYNIYMYVCICCH